MSKTATKSATNKTKAQPYQGRHHLARRQALWPWWLLLFTGLVLLAGAGVRLGQF